jgi:ribosomal protein L11 methyltransferase
VPYRIDIDCQPSDALEVLVRLGALDVELAGDGLAAILPDTVTPDAVARQLGIAGVTVSPAVARDADSVWLLSTRAVRIGSVAIAPPDGSAPQGALRLRDSGAFGTGHHPTTALCIEALEELLTIERIASVLDIGTGSGILALAALRLGVPHAVGLDIDADALNAAAENARLNDMAERLQLVCGGPDAVNGVWPLVVANVLAAPLIAMAPQLAPRVASQGTLILSGISRSAASEVRKAYEHLGMRCIGSEERAGWTMLIARASW